MSTPPPPRQQGLFGPLDPAPKPRRDRPAAAAVAPHPADDAVRALAHALPPNLRLGTSSWTFPGWQGLVYGAGASERALVQHGLAAYAQHPLLRTVGIDRTYYAPLPADEFARYAAAVPPDFRFLVKAWSGVLTPRERGSTRRADPRWLDAATTTARVLEPACRGLGERLGVIVLQFPPQGRDVVQAPQQFAARLHDFLAALPRLAPLAVELRDPELCTAEHVAVLAAAGVQHCYAVHPRAPTLAQQRERAAPSGPVTIRWMLQPEATYDEAVERFAPFDRLAEPDPASRRAIAALCRDALAKGLPVTVVVNNKAEGCAPLSLLELARAIAQG